MAPKRHKPAAAVPARPTLVPLPETVDEGWLHDEITPITAAALEKVDAPELHEMLTLDAPDVGAMRPFYQERASSWRERSEARTRLAEMARECQRRLDEELASEPLWRRLVARAQPNLVRDFAAVSDAVATLAIDGAATARRRAEGYERSTPRHDEKGTRAFTPEHYRRLLRLVNALESWSLAKLVELILASATDWNDPPCPELARTYRTNPQGLQKLLSTRRKRACEQALAEAAKKAAAKNRATQETEARE